MNPTYEHHFDIRKNSRVPFKHEKRVGTLSDVYNWHKNVEILYITGGEGIVRYGACELPAVIGDVFVINCDAFHQVKSAEGVDFNYMIIDESFCRENGIVTEDFLFEQHFRDPLTAHLYTLAADAIDTLAHYAFPTAVARAREAVLSLLIHLCEEHAVSGVQRTGTPSPAEEYVKRTVTYLDVHFAEPQSLDALAAHLGITKHHLARAFKQYTGETVFTHLNRVRLRHAEAALRAGADVTEAALLAGFESLSYFSRTYKKYMGVSPSQEKKKTEKKA